jgi:hypothetical protein
MQFINLTVAALSAVLLTATVSAADCQERENCCYSSGAACRRQLGFGAALIGICSETSYDPSAWTLCEDVNVTRQQCVRITHPPKLRIPC